MKNKKKNNSDIIDFMSVYPDYNIDKLPRWIRDDIENVVVTGYRNKTLISSDGRKYHLDNKLNDLSGSEWTYFTNSVIATRYPTKGEGGYAHEIRKIHPTPKPPQLMREIIEFFTKENELILDSFMGVGGTLIGASLCNRDAIGVDINQKYIDTYKIACRKLKIKIQKTYCDDSVNFFNRPDIDNIIDRKLSFILIDPPYANMMSVKKTGQDIKKYGKNSTPFSDDERDLGNMTKNDFLLSLQKSIESSLNFLKNNGHIAIFIKDLQPKDDEINMLHYDVAKTISNIKSVKYIGMKIWADESSTLFPYGYPFSYVSNQIHQYILFFKKNEMKVDVNH